MGTALWNVDSGRCIKVFGDDFSDCVAFSPNGQRIVSARVGSLRLSDVNGEFIRESDRNGGFYDIENVAFSPDGKSIVTCVVEGQIFVLWMQ